MNLSFDGKGNVIKLKRLESLYCVAETISSKLHLEDILESIPPAVKEITGNDEMLVALVDKTSDGFAIDPKTMRHTCPHPSQLMPKSNRWLCAQTVIKTSKPTMISSSGSLVSYDQLNDQSASDIVFTVVPLSTQNKSLGFLSVLAPKKRNFNRVDIMLLTILANQIAVAIENARLHKKVQELILSEERSRIAKEILTVIMKDNIYNKISPISLMNGREGLTDKERQILALMAKGYTNEEIAKELWVGLKTVKTHVSSILKKLGQKNRVQAIVCALKRGLVDFSPD